MRTTMTIAAATMLLLGASAAHANDWGNPSTDWGGHIRFSDPNNEQVNLNRADMLKREKGGYYDQWHTTSITNNYGDTNIENMNSSTAIGSQVVTEVSINGDNNNVDQHAHSSSSNHGSTGAGIYAPANDTNFNNNYYNN